jgi:hypothetical protein
MNWLRDSLKNDTFTIVLVLSALRFLDGASANLPFRSQIDII